MCIECSTPKANHNCKRYAGCDITPIQECQSCPIKQVFLLFKEEAFSNRELHLSYGMKTLLQYRTRLSDHRRTQQLLEEVLSQRPSPTALGPMQRTCNIKESKAFGILFSLAVGNTGPSQCDEKLALSITPQTEAATGADWGLSACSSGIKNSNRMSERQQTMCLQTRRGY